MSDNNSDFLALASDVIAAYVSNNSVSRSDLPALIERVYSAISECASGASSPAKVELVPAISIKKSIAPDFIVCLEDGKKFKSLKRHLRTSYGMTPEDYRAKWNLPSDYPMVAPNYAASRSALAKKMGLGQVRQSAPAVSSRETKKTRGRKRAA